MNSFLWGLYIFILVLAFFPLFKLGLFSTGHKYYYFKHMSISLFIWVLLSGLEFGIRDPQVLYIFILLKYPLVFSTISMAFTAVLRYMGKKIPQALSLFIVLFFILDFLMSISNSTHQLMLDIGMSSEITREAMVSANHGSFFMIHLIVSYSFFLGTFVLITSHFYQAFRKENDLFPFVVIMITGIMGITLNVIHVFFYAFQFDPTYMIFVIYSSILYFIFIIRDVRLIIKLGNNTFLLKNLREMYLIVNHNEEVVEASEALLERFDIPLNDGKPLKEVMDILQKKAIIYTDSKEEIKEFNSDKSYIHIETKDIRLPFLKYYGQMILFYDETQIQKYIHDMDYVMNHDLMTGLYNRNYLESIRNTYNDLTDYSMILFDLDGLKLLNDYLGHHEGDQLLIRFSSVLQEIANQKSDCIPIRMGGDEFLLVLKSTQKEEIENIIDTIQNQTKDSDMRKSIGFSYGYFINNKKDHFSHSLSEADVMMYQMKDQRIEKKKELRAFLKSLTKVNND
jgi:diguanylate cyclase (GGDEF)-like protein